MHHPTADRPIEHPLGCLQTACTLLTRLAAAQQAHTTPAHDSMNEHHAAEPWMPGIKNFPFLGPVGVMLPSCTMDSGSTTHSAKTRHSIERSSTSVASLQDPFSEAFITNITDFDLWHIG
jgi:hypothetical protein